MADPTEEQIDRVRLYLHAQAASLSIEELKTKVSGTVDELEAVALQFDADHWTATPAGEEWAPRDCFNHIASYNLAIATQVLTACLMGYIPEFEPRSLEGDASAMTTAYREGVDSLYAHVDAADPQAFLDLKWPHFWFGDLNWREWLLFLRVHNLDHTQQLQAMLPT